MTVEQATIGDRSRKHWASIISRGSTPACLPAPHLAQVLGHEEPLKPGGDVEGNVALEVTLKILAEIVVHQPTDGLAEPLAVGRADRIGGPVKLNDGDGKGRRRRRDGRHLHRRNRARAHPARTTHSIPNAAIRAALSIWHAYS